MVNPFRGTWGVRLRVAAGAFACSTTITLASTLVSPAASAQQAQSSDRAAELAAAVAGAQSEVDSLRLGIGDLQERVNQSFVDLRDAQARAAQARQAASAASERLKAAQEAVDKARKELDEVTRAQYRGTGQPGVVGALSGDSEQKDTLDRAQYLRQRSAEKAAALQDIERARAEAANEESLAREASQLADSSVADAQQAEANTRELLDATTAELESRQGELDEAQRKLDSAEGDLAKARAGEEGADTAGIKDGKGEQGGEDGGEKAQPKADPAVMAEVERQVTELAPEANPSKEELAQALATAQSAAGAGTEGTAGAASGDASAAASPEVVEQAANIAAATSLVGASQAPHATFDDPYAANAHAPQLNISLPANSSANTAANAAATAASAREIISAFAGGLQTGLGLDGGSSTSNETSGDVSQPLTDLLPKVETSESVTEDIKDAVHSADSGSVEAVIARAQSMVGTPYVWGGGDANGPTGGMENAATPGFDCSGLVLYAFAAAGISLPHYTGYQYQRGTQVDPSEAQRGDLLFWGPGGSQHVAIYLGDGQMIEAPSSGQTVRVSPVRWAGMSPKAVRLL